MISDNALLRLKGKPIVRLEKVQKPLNITYIYYDIAHILITRSSSVKTKHHNIAIINLLFVFYKTLAKLNKQDLHHKKILTIDNINLLKIEIQMH